MIVGIVAPFVEYALLAWFGAMMVFIVYKLLDGTILTHGLISDRRGTSFAFHRLQLIAVTLLFAGGYIIAALGKGPGQAMPDIAPPLLAGLLGSHFTYLGGKLFNN
jgi:hypothetical protein